jgi:hypothetical protein
MKPIVYIIHHVDTEGPLYEDIKATFKRINNILGVHLTLKPTRENLRKLQSGVVKELNNEQNAKVKIITQPHLLEYKKSWAELDEMLYRILSSKYRNKVKDSFGGGWVYNWHIMDHVGFDINPRHRDMGYMNIFEHYQSILEETGSDKIDEIEWYFHPVNYKKQANLSATSYENSYPLIHQILTRRLIEKNWFPVVNRPGMHTERPDSNWFLEQWLPFDAANQSIKNDDYISNGRFGDWKGAPDDWTIYHPSIYDWRSVGNCNRYIARILNLNTRFRNITEDEISKAFNKARTENTNVYLGVDDHDWREMSQEIEGFLNMLIVVKKNYPDVDFKFSRSIPAFKAVLGLNKENTVNFTSKIEDNLLTIEFIKGEPFGPQPYLAIKTTDGIYFHDNLDFGEFKKIYYYTFDDDTVRLENIKSLVIATNDRYGNQCIKRVID